MTSPVETIADALIAFILSLLKDPNAAEEFTAQPTKMLADNGLQNACMADVDVVRPIIIDNPRVIHHDNPPPPPPPGPDDHETVREIVRMVQQYTTIDARSTVVDQSVNQNIWTEGGDVTQLFDQEAVVASGDDAIAAGDDVSVVDSDVDVSMGDVSMGNETNDGSFNQTGDGSFNDTEDGADEVEPESGEAAPDAAETTPDPAETTPDAAETTPDAAETTPDDAAATATTAAVDAADTAVDAAAAAQPATPPPPADVPEPADLLEGDMTSGGGDDAYEADTSTAVVDDVPVDAPIETD